MRFKKECIGYVDEEYGYGDSCFHINNDNRCTFFSCECDDLLEGAETISKESTPKQVEAHNNDIR